MSDITQVAHVLRNYRTFRQKPGSHGGGANHAGLKHLKNADFDRVAKRILQRSWHNRKVTSSLFKMAESVEALLHLHLKWKERYDLGRLLISSLTYAGLYRLEQEAGGNEASPYFIVATGQSLSVDNAPPHRTRTDHPFPRWTSNCDDDGNRLVKPSYPSPPELEYSPVIPRTLDEGFLPWLEAVHALESVPFGINEEFLDLVIQLDKKEQTRIIPKTYKPYAREKKKLDQRREKDGIARLEKLWKKYKASQKKDKKRDEKRRRQKKPKLPRSNCYQLSVDEQQVLFKYLGDLYRLKRIKRSYEDRRATFEKELKQAVALKGKTFYQRLKMCHRGRIYYPEFSYQGSDFARAVIEFAEGMNINISGWEHLLIHTANVFGESDDVDARLQKGIDGAEEYLAIGLDPEGQFNQWAKADKPYCFLRSCLEVTDGMAVVFQSSQSRQDRKKYSKEQKRLIKQVTERWRETGRGTIIDGEVAFSTHLPVELDQSNSAFQHIALMMDDKELQEKANMGSGWSDLYTEVAKSNRMNISGLTDAKEKRKIIKLVAVPWSYGADNRTCADALVKFREESPRKATYLNTLTVQEVNELTDQVIKLLEDEFETCVKYRKRVEACVEAVKTAGISQVIRWVTPLFFHMIQRKHEVKSFQSGVWSGSKDVEPQVLQPRDIDWQKNKTSLPANLVHSMDAALIHAVLCFGRFTGHRDKDTGTVWVEFAGPEERIFYPVVTIHDALACHAPNAFDLKDKLVSGLAELYKYPDPLRAFLAQTEGGEFEPRDRDINWAKTAKNIFS